MFDNIGGKIKMLAKVVCWIGIAISVIAAIALWCNNLQYNPTILAGFIVLIGGCAGSWVGSFFMYGFGELIENSQVNREYLHNCTKMLNSMNKEANAGEASKGVEAPAAAPVQNIKRYGDRWCCPKCQEYNSTEARFCKSCGYSR